MEDTNQAQRVNDVSWERQLLILRDAAMRHEETSLLRLNIAQTRKH